LIESVGFSERKRQCQPPQLSASFPLFPPPPRRSFFCSKHMGPPPLSRDAALPFPFLQKERLYPPSSSDANAPFPALSISSPSPGQRCALSLGAPTEAFSPVSSLAQRADLLLHARWMAVVRFSLFFFLAAALLFGFYNHRRPPLYRGLFFFFRRHRARPSLSSTGQLDQILVPLSLHSIFAGWAF